MYIKKNICITTIQKIVTKNILDMGNQQRNPNHGTKQQFDQILLQKKNKNNLEL